MASFVLWIFLMEVLGGSGRSDTEKARSKPLHTARSLRSGLARNDGCKQYHKQGALGSDPACASSSAVTGEDLVKQPFLVLFKAQLGEAFLEN